MDFAKVGVVAAILAIFILVGGYLQTGQAFWSVLKWVRALWHRKRGKQQEDKEPPLQSRGIAARDGATIRGNTVVGGDYVKKSGFNLRTLKGMMKLLDSARGPNTDSAKNTKSSSVRVPPKRIPAPNDEIAFPTDQTTKISPIAIDKSNHSEVTELSEQPQVMESADVTPIFALTDARETHDAIVLQSPLPTTLKVETVEVEAADEDETSVAEIFPLAFVMLSEDQQMPVLPKGGVTPDQVTDVDELKISDKAELSEVKDHEIHDEVYEAKSSASVNSEEQKQTAQLLLNPSLELEVQDALLLRSWQGDQSDMSISEEAKNIDNSEQSQIARDVQEPLLQPREEPQPHMGELGTIPLEGHESLVVNIPEPSQLGTPDLEMQRQLKAILDTLPEEDHDVAILLLDLAPTQIGAALRSRRIAVTLSQLDVSHDSGWVDQLERGDWQVGMIPLSVLVKRVHHHLMVTGWHAASLRASAKIIPSE